MELSELLGDPKWIEVEGTALKLCMKPYPVGLLLGRNSFTVEAYRTALQDSIVSWNLQDNGRDIEVNADLLPLHIVPAIMVAWQTAYTQVSSPLSPRPRSTRGAAAKRKPRRS